MYIGMIGLGRMGGSMTRRLLDGGHAVVVFDTSPERVDECSRAGAEPSASLESLAHRLTEPRVIWLMVPAGDPVEQTLDTLLPHLTTGDIIVDGGNSYYKDSIRRAKDLEVHGIRMLDVGVSGGIWGLSEGYCLTVGGSKEAFQLIEPILQTLAATDGYAHAGPSGAGHYVKMVHNGVEYGMLEAYGEGFGLLRASGFHLDLDRIANLWRHGSVVRSWLLDLAARALEEDPDLSSISGYVEDTGEGRWTVHEAVERGVPLPAIAAALFARFTSQQDGSFSAKVIAALRREFGGHNVRQD